MSLSTSNSSSEGQSLDSREDDEDVSTDPENEEDIQSGPESMGMAPYQFEPVTTVDDSGTDSSSDEDDEGPVWRLSNTDWYVVAVKIEFL